MTIKIVNVYNCIPTHYCGRLASYRPIYGVNLSILGNPFVVSRLQTRDEACDKYLEYFKSNIDKFAKPLQEIKEYHLKYGELRLGCFCYPKRCHCETIRDWLTHSICCGIVPLN